MKRTFHSEFWCALHRVSQLPPNSLLLIWERFSSHFSDAIDLFLTPSFQWSKRYHGYHVDYVSMYHVHLFNPVSDSPWKAALNDLSSSSSCSWMCRRCWCPLVCGAETKYSRSLSGEVGGEVVGSELECCWRNFSTQFLELSNCFCSAVLLTFIFGGIKLPWICGKSRKEMLTGLGE